MGKPGRPVAELVLLGDERDELERLTKRALVNRNLAVRARLVLACASGMTNTAVAQRYRTTNQTVGKWRRRFVENRLEGLYDEPRPGGPRTVTDDAVEAVLVKTLEEKPKGRTHWSTRSMAAQVGLSHATIGRMWRTFGLKPHGIRSFKSSDDPQVLPKGRDFLRLSMNHADVFLVAQLGGALLWAAHPTSAPARIAHVGARPSSSNHRFRRCAQRSRQALHVGQDGRRDPRQGAALRPAHAAGAPGVKVLLGITDPGD